jgi:cation transport ATPase
MPKAAAIQPLEWATVHDNFEGFDLAELNRVVIDYAYIELHRAGRWSRRSPLGRVCAALLYCLMTVGLIAAVGLGILLIAGVTEGEFPVFATYIGAGLGCVVVAGFFVPWALTPYRQWDRTLCGISVMMAVVAVVSLGSIAARSFEAAPRWLLAAPCVLLLLVAIGAIVGNYRLRTTSKPPAVDIATLSPEEVEVLRAARRGALKRLRARNIVPYRDFAKFDAAPLDPAEPSADHER